MSSPMFMLCFFVVSQMDDGLNSRLLEVRDLHEANRATMAVGSLKFSFTRGAADSIGNARAGELNRAHTGRGRLLFAGESAYMEVLYTRAELAAARRKVAEDRFSSPITPYRAITDGQIMLKDRQQLDFSGSELLHSLATAPAESFYRDTRLPLNLGTPRPGVFSVSTDIDLCLDNKIQLIALSAAEFEGGDCLYLKFQKAAGTTEYWIDMAHGAIPRRVLDQNTENGNRFDQYQDDIRSNDNGGWLPTTLTFCGAGTSIVERVQATEWSFHEPPASQSFVLEFPTPVPVVDKLKGVRLPPDTTWSIRKLKGEGTAQPLRSAAPPLPAALTLRESSRPPWLPILIGSVAALGSVGVLVLWLRRQAS